MSNAMHFEPIDANNVRAAWVSSHQLHEIDLDLTEAGLLQSGRMEQVARFWSRVEVTNLADLDDQIACDRAHLDQIAARMADLRDQAFIDWLEARGLDSEDNQ